MNLKDTQIALKIKKRLQKESSLLDFRVFGSRARGDNEEDSDMDLFIAVPSIDGRLKERLSDIIWEEGLEHFLVITPLIVTREELEDTPLRSSPIIEMIKREGISL